MLQFY